MAYPGSPLTLDRQFQSFDQTGYISPHPLPASLDRPFLFLRISSRGLHAFLFVLAWRSFVASLVTRWRLSPWSHELQSWQCFPILLVSVSRSAHWIVHLLALKALSSLAVCMQSNCNKNLTQDLLCSGNFSRHRSVKIAYSKIWKSEQEFDHKTWYDRSTFKNVTSQIDSISFILAFLLMLSSLSRLRFCWAITVSVAFSPAWPQEHMFRALSLLCPFGLLDFSHREEVDSG